MDAYILEAFKFMALGMGIVFMFLILLVAVMYTQAFIILKFFKQLEPLPKNDNLKSNNNAKIAAVIAAVTYHKEH